MPLDAWCLAVSYTHLDVYKRQVVLNGEKISPSVTGEQMDESTYRYDMSFPDQQVKITARLLVLENNVVEFKVTDIKEGGDYKVRTISLGENNWAYADDKMEGASYAWTKSNGEWHGVSAVSYTHLVPAKHPSEQPHP